jgi:hypothetical protein
MASGDICSGARRTGSVLRVPGWLREYIGGNHDLCDRSRRGPHLRVSTDSDDSAGMVLSPTRTDKED